MLVAATEKLLGSAVGNLVSNVIKYSNAGKKVVISLVERDESIDISVQDEGVGISGEDRKRLFRKFERLSARPTGGETSSGLGLYIVRLIVSRLGGEVRCESEKGKGSTFVITLPLGGP